jgi:hypothetical protein
MKKLLACTVIGIIVGFTACRSTPASEARELDVYTFSLNVANRKYQQDEDIKSYCIAFVTVNETYPNEASVIREQNKKSFDDLVRTCKNLGIK